MKTCNLAESRVAALVSLGSVLVFAAFAQVSPAAAAEGPARAQQRASIEDERARIEAQFSAEMADCQRRFAITACIDDVRKRRREALAAPRAAALALDDLDRQERAIARRDAVQAKQREAAARVAPSLAASAPRPRELGPPAAAAPASAALVPPRGSAAAAASAAERAARRRADAARSRQQEIQATQARIRARQQERIREGKAAAPLPVPAASR